MRRQLILAAAALLVARLLLSLLRTGPLVVADEVGYLTNARVLSGGISGQLQNAPFYRGGYSLLIAPLIRLDGDPGASYRLVLALNAMLAAALVPLLYVLLVRSFRAPPRAALWASAAAAAYPSVTLFSQAALSENLLLPLSVLWLICCAELLEARRQGTRTAWALAAGATAAALYAVHGRMIVAVALTIAGLAVCVLRRRLTVLPAALGVTVTLISLEGVRVLDRFLVTHNYGGRQPDEVGQRLSTLESVDGILSFLRNLVGQGWYLAVATLGVLGWFAMTASRGDVRTARRTDAPASQFVLGLMIATLGGLLILSALSFPAVERPDMLIYGRYTEILVPPLLAVALIRLPRTGVGFVRPLLLVGLTTVVVATLRTTVHPTGSANRWDVGSLPFLTLDLRAAALIGGGVVACAVLIGLIAIGRRRPALLAPAVLLLFLPTTAFVERDPILSGERAVYPPGWTSPGSVNTRGRAVAYDIDHHDGLYVNQWFMPRSRFVLFSSGDAAPPAPYVISSRNWGRQHRNLAPVRLWDDPGHDHALFEVSRRP